MDLHAAGELSDQRAVGRRSAAVSADRNPIHLYPLTAKAFGFKRPIAHGMWSAARCVAAIENRLPDAMTVDVLFRKPVFLPSTVAFGCRLAIDSDADTSTGMTGNYILQSGDSNLTVDAGAYRPASLGDFVWDDLNGNGKQDAGEPGINGVTATLTGTDGLGNAVSLTTTTAGNGGYLFTGLVPGTYKVTF